MTHDWENIILSYPRSGSNLLYYSINEIINTGIGKTHGQYKEFWEDGVKFRKLIFMIRDYKECIPRHTGVYSFDVEFKSQVSNYKTNDKPHHDYISLLDFYHNYVGDKMIIYYEDFVINMDHKIREIIRFLSDDDYEYQINEFILNINEHKVKSMNRYNKISLDWKVIYNSRLNGCTSLNELGNPDLFYHSKQLSDTDKSKMDEYIKNNYPNFNEYLIRYS